MALERCQPVCGVHACMKDGTTKPDLPECLLKEAVPIADCSSHSTDVNVVEMVFGPGPVLFAVVDFEFDIWRNPDTLVLGSFTGGEKRGVPCRLYRTQIDGAHLGSLAWSNKPSYPECSTCAAGVLFSEINRPYPGTSANI